MPLISQAESGGDSSSVQGLLKQVRVDCNYTALPYLCIINGSGDFVERGIKYLTGAITPKPEALNPLPEFRLLYQHLEKGP